MNVGEYQVVGFSKYTNDKGQVGTNLFLVTPFEPWEQKNTCIGYKTVQEFTYADVNCNVNDLISIQYGKGFGGKAVINGITVIKSGK